MRDNEARAPSRYKVAVAPRGEWGPQEKGGSGSLHRSAPVTRNPHSSWVCLHYSPLMVKGGPGGPSTRPPSLAPSWTAARGPTGGGAFPGWTSYSLPGPLPPFSLCPHSPLGAAATLGAGASRTLASLPFSLAPSGLLSLSKTIQLLWKATLAYMRPSLLPSFFCWGFHYL